MTSSKSKVPTVRVTGPLAPYATEFTRCLTQRGYRPSTCVGHLQVMAHLSRWLQDRQLGVRELNTQRVEEYLAERRARCYSSFRTRARVAPLLEVLAGHGAGVDPPPAASRVVSDTDALLAGYERFLRQERGLAPSTVAAYLLRARRFLAAHPDLASVTAVEVSAAVVREAQALSVPSAKVLAGSLRWLLRYAHVSGVIDTDLSAAVVPVTGRRPSWLPRGIGREGADAVLAACDRRTSTGRRTTR